MFRMNVNMDFAHTDRGRFLIKASKKIWAQNPKKTGLNYSTNNTKLLKFEQNVRGRMTITGCYMHRNSL